MKKVAILLSLVVFFTVSCENRDQESQVSDISFTLCKQSEFRSSREDSITVVVEFSNKGVQITHYNFEVPCDFTTINVTHTLVNGVLRITQQGCPNQANCICHSDVSYTIEGITQNEVNVIFINGKQVYCHSDKEDHQSKNLVGKWLTSHYRSDSVIVFTEDLRVLKYLDYIFANQVIPALYQSTYVSYSILNDEITFTINYFYPSTQKIDETFKYVLNGNSLTIKGFSNPFSLTAEARSDVHFTKIDEDDN